MMREEYNDYELLIRIDERVENLTKSVNALIKSQNKQNEELHERVDFIENELYTWKGIVKVLSILFGAAVTIGTALITAMF